MDIVDIIIENIEASDALSICKLVEHFVTEGRNKHLLSSTIITLFSQKYIDSNLWLLKELHNNIAKLEKSTAKNKKELENNLKNMCCLLSFVEQRNIILYEKSISSKIQFRIEKLIASNHKEFEDIAEFKEDVHYECYSLLNVFYNNIAYATDLKDNFTIIRYFLDVKKTTLLITNTYTDIIDLLFTIIIKYINNNRLPDGVKEFVLMCKDLFYYRIKQKEKIPRINLLFYATYILMKRQTTYQEIDYELPNTPKNKHKSNNSTEYLYVIIPYDDKAIKEVRNDKELAKVFERPRKMINLKNEINTRTPSNINIVKI